jgi:hypothetical protein
MITQAELIKQISNTLGKARVLELSRILEEQHFALRDLVDITFNVTTVRTNNIQKRPVKS